MRRLRISGKTRHWAPCCWSAGNDAGRLYSTAHADAERTEGLQGAHQTQRMLELVFRAGTPRRRAACRGRRPSAIPARHLAKALGQARRRRRRAAAPVDARGALTGRPQGWDLADATAGGSDELVARHAASVELQRGRILRVAEDTGLLLDPLADTYFLMDQVVVGSVPWLESLALLRDRGADLLTRGEASPGERAGVLAQADRIQSQIAEVDRRVASLQRAGVTEPAGWAAAKSASLGAASRARELFSAPTSLRRRRPSWRYRRALPRHRACRRNGRAADRRLEARQQEHRNLWLHMGVVAGVAAWPTSAWLST
jgi:hypothetical protein